MMRSIDTVAPREAVPWFAAAEKRVWELPLTDTTLPSPSDQLQLVRDSLEQETYQSWRTIRAMSLFVSCSTRRHPVISGI